MFLNNNSAMTGGSQSLSKNNYYKESIPIGGIKRPDIKSNHGQIQHKWYSRPYIVQILHPNHTSTQVTSKAAKYESFVSCILYK